jgi:hypothetical protein
VTLFEGLVIFRATRRAGRTLIAVSELFMRPKDSVVARGLLRRATNAVAADYAVGSFPSGTSSARGARGTFFLPRRGRVVLAANPVANQVLPDPIDMRSWALSLGGVKVI